MVDTPISGATASTYTLVEADVGHDIYCRVTGTNSVGASSANSNTVGPIVEVPAWTPADLGAALIAWYDATTEVYNVANTTLATNGQDVNQWKDQSGNNCHLTAGAAFPPTYATAGFNTSHPAVMLHGAAADEAMETVADTVPQGGGAALSCFVVTQMLTDTDSYGRLIAYRGNGQTSDADNASSAPLIIRSTTTNNIVAFRNGVLTTAAVSLATNYRLGIIFDGTNVKLYINNAEAATAASTGNFSSPGRLMLGIPAGNTWAGPIAEIVITNTALDGTARTQLDDYFKTKWGLI